MTKYPHIEEFKKEIERVSRENGHYYAGRRAILQLVEDAGIEDIFDMYCQRAIAEAADYSLSLITWTSLLTKYLMPHKTLFAHRNIMMNN